MSILPSLSDKPIAVFGLARSGLAVVRALAAKTRIIAWDDNAASREEAQKLGAELAPLTEENLKDCAFLVLAPGVPLHFPKPHPVVLEARAAGIEIICDIELLHRTGHGRRTIGITGTNGKSTTTALIQHILKQSGRDSAMGGNIGKAVFDLAMPGPDGVFVFELSSFQIDLCPGFRPDIGVLLNITPDHLDRHGTMENYAAIKAKIFEGEGAAIIGSDDDYCRDIIRRVEADGRRKIIPFSVRDDFLKKIMEKAALKGEHNYQNALAAWHACREIGLSEDEVAAGLQSFPGLPHRQFPVRRIDRAEYINDSKATNAESAAKALGSYRHIYWIAGGRAKDGGLSGLESYAGKIRHAFLIGEAAEDFAIWCAKNKIAHTVSFTMDKAVSSAHDMAQKSGEDSTVLLSPACSSYDQYKDFEARGDDFARLVGELKERAAA